MQFRIRTYTCMIAAHSPYVCQ